MRVIESAHWLSVEAPPLHARLQQFGVGHDSD
jgi:hypothetical protein